MRGNPLYLFAALALLVAPITPARGDIPPTPELKKKIAETPRIMPKGELKPLADRRFGRTAGGAKAKVVIPKAVFDELAAAVAGKADGQSPPTAKEGGVPPIALILAGLALSCASLILLAKAPRYRLATSIAAALIAAGGLFMWTRDVEANAGPPRPRPAEGQIIIEVPAEGTEVFVYVPEAASKKIDTEAKPR